jgi:alkylation response protein AidB-like acyl-CoA dehydrogenase
LDRQRVAVLREEMRRIGARQPLAELNTGIKMLAPILFAHGSEEQQRRFLPPIAHGKVRWCQGYSEPEAGSDLAALRTRAVLAGDHYVVNGHKIWSSYAHVSDWIFCLVRTGDDKRGGISFLLIDLDSPGITVEPITLLSGRSDFCEVHFSDVAVPRNHLVGEQGGGWPIAKNLLAHERAMLGSAGGGLSGGGSRSASLASIVATALSDRGDESDVIADRFGAHFAELQALKATTTRYAQERRTDPAVPSVVKLVSTELNMKREDLMCDLLGLDAMTWDGDAATHDGTTRARAWLRSRANSIEGGTSEIQLNIIAKHGLGLPQAATS